MGGGQDADPRDGERHGLSLRVLGEGLGRWAIRALKRRLGPTRVLKDAWSADEIAPFQGAL
jgi:hypothetical protein